MTAALDGAAAEAVTRWLTERVAGVSPPLTFTVIEGGRSNLSYEVRDRGGRRWVLRRPPLSGVLPSAHDMGREFRIVRALAGTDVPVPPVVGECTDPDLIGAPFYVMDFVDGVVLRDAPTAERHVALPLRRRVAESLVDTLAELHRVEPAAVGLDDLGPGSGYIERQLRRWSRQLERLESRPLPVMTEVAAALGADIPPQLATTIVHGDYRLGNVIVGSDGEVVAVLDWELCTIGDPLADLGWMLAYWSAPDGARPLPLSMPTAAPGFPPAAEALDRYAAVSGSDVTEIGYYVAFALWKLAAILEGVRVRSVRGAYGGTEQQAAQLDDAVIELAEAARRLVGGQRVRRP